MPATIKGFKVLNFELVVWDTPCERGKPHVKIITRAVDAIKQLINRPGVVLVPVIVASCDTPEQSASEWLEYPGKTLMSDGLADILIVRPPLSVILAPSPSYKSIPINTNA
jgi:hypothetical protein